ncbi:glycosyltransferase [Bacillus sp. JCM 19045]|nr:glycosyltransferase [Bacillus sp. JCM 19045]
MNKDYENKATSYYQGINQQLFHLIEPSVKNVLDIGCGEGALGEAIKHTYKAGVHGFEQFPNAAERAQEKLDSITLGNIEEDLLPYKKASFDAIIFADVLEHMIDPWAVLDKVKPYLSKTGCVYASIPNVGHISIIEELLKGTWGYVDAGLLDKTHLRFFTKHEIQQLFNTSGYAVEMIVNNQSALPHQQELVAKLKDAGLAIGLPMQDFEQRAFAYQYMLKAKPI